MLSNFRPVYGAVHGPRPFSYCTCPSCWGGETWQPGLILRCRGLRVISRNSTYHMRVGVKILLYLRLIGRSRIDDTTANICIDDDCSHTWHTHTRAIATHAKKLLHPTHSGMQQDVCMVPPNDHVLLHLVAAPRVRWECIGKPS